MYADKVKSKDKRLDGTGNSKRNTLRETNEISKHLNILLYISIMESKMININNDD